MKTETITYRAFSAAIRRAEKKQLESTGKSMCAASIGQQCTLMKFGARIVSCFDEKKTMEIEGDWRKAIAAAAALYS